MSDASSRGFQDHFSAVSKGYRANRPLYPAALFDFLAGMTPRHDLAWDCATGNGQAAVPLAEHFQSVIATDASPQQIEHAVEHPRVRYEVAPADRVPIVDGSVDLITVAQALHWFDLPKFYAEVRRVSRPEAIIAVWSYGLQTINPEIDAIIHRAYGGVLAKYWPEDRRWVEEKYETIDFPFERVTTPEFPMVEPRDLPQFLGYLQTWSACKRYREATGKDPLDLIRRELENAWGNAAQVRPIAWPFHVLVGRVCRGE
jgi:SAM-dependent methyltransferase